MGTKIPKGRIKNQAEKPGGGEGARSFGQLGDFTRALRKGEAWKKN